MLFVYGSLKSGECNFDQVGRWVRSVRPATLPGRLFLRPDGYPALWVPQVGDVSQRARPVPGEVLELHPAEEALRELDQFEGCPHEYLRVATEVGWVYVCRWQQTAGWTEIESWPPPGHPTPAPYTGGTTSG